METGISGRKGTTSCTETACVFVNFRLIGAWIEKGTVDKNDNEVVKA